MFFVTFVHVVPPSRVFHSCPSFVPAQIRPRRIVEGAIENTTSP